MRLSQPIAQLRIFAHDISLWKNANASYSFAICCDGKYMRRRCIQLFGNEHLGIMQRLVRWVGGAIGFVTGISKVEALGAEPEAAAMKPDVESLISASTKETTKIMKKLIKTVASDRELVNGPDGEPIASRLVMRMGGTISVANRPEGGAAFTVSLPDR
jgi:hypothetical protein